MSQEIRSLKQDNGCHKIQKSSSDIQWRSEGGAGGGICPRAPPGGGRQNPDK